jgi:transposase
VLSEGTARQWRRMFKDGRTNVNDDERSGRPSVVSDDLVQVVHQKLCERRASQLRNLCVNFHKFHAFSCTGLAQLG